MHTAVGTMSATTPATTPPGTHTPVAVLLAGWGTKEGSRFKTWKRRFFILRSATAEEMGARVCTHVLVYYKTQKQVIGG